MNFINRLSIGARLGAAFAMLLVLLCAVAALGAGKVASTNDHVLMFSENVVPSLRAIDHLRGDVSVVRRVELAHLLMTTAQDKETMDARLADTRKSIDRQLQDYRKLILDDQDGRNLDAVQAALQAYYAQVEKLRSLSRDSAGDPAKLEEGRHLLLGDSAAAYNAVSTALDAFWAYNEQAGERAAGAAAAGYRAALAATIGFSVVAVVLGVLCAWWITRSITTPLRVAMNVADRIGRGDLSSRIEVGGGDETAQLLTSLRDMNTSLVDIVSQVRRSSDSIATGSAQIAAGNADLSQRTEEQASNLQQTAASMEQLTSTVRTNADAAREASRLAGDAAAVASRGGDAVQGVVATMSRITESSRKISDIIGVIDGIAFQTNILALNAAVEAARAGEQGRGFAVVAGEVRTLAQRSGQAAREIKQLIVDSVERVDEGARQCDDAGRTMADIVQHVGRVANLVGEITNASQEQSQGIGQVGDAVTQLDQVTQQNAALVEESAAAAESLKLQAGRLAETVTRFRLAD